MAIRSIMALVLTVAIIAIIVVGLINSNLMVELWAKLLTGVLFAGVPVTIIKALLA
jgi:hypothetical protein